MKIQTNKIIQVTITVLYPIVAFCLLSVSDKLDSWLIPILVMFIFSLLWRNLRYLLISTLSMWVVSIPLWWFLIERSEGDQGAAIFSSSLPFIILAFIACVLIPQILIVTIKNFMINKFSERRH